MQRLEALGAFAASSGHARDGVLRETVALHAVDAVVAWAAGATTGEARALRDAGLDGIALRCACARLSELDDIHLASCTTPGGIVVPAALTVAATLPAVGSETLVDAIVAGYETMVRVGLALGGPSILFRGIWPTYLAAPLAVAAVAARLHGLDAQAAANALALAATRAAPGVGRAAAARWLAIGDAARTGLHAALWASRGIVADTALFDGPFLANVYGIEPARDAFAGGARPHVADAAFKPWCAARQTMAATQALRELLDDGLEPAAIEAIEVAVPPAYAEMIAREMRPGDRSSHVTSVAYALAAAAFEPRRLDDVRHLPDALPEPMRALVARVRVRPDPALGELYPASWPARVAVDAAGRRYEKLVLHVPGDPERPFARADVAAKAERVLGPRAAPLLAAASAALDDPARIPALLAMLA